MIHTMELSLQLNRVLFEKIEENLSGLRFRCNNLTSTAYMELGFEEISLVSKKTATDYRYLGLQLRINPAVIIMQSRTAKITPAGKIDTVQRIFNCLLKEIFKTEHLPDFYYWNCRRIDYAFDIASKNVKEHILLFKKADWPARFSEDCKNRPGSYYLQSGSVTINFYDKEDQVKKKECSTDIELRYAKNTIRLEVQCKKDKVQNIKKTHGFPDKSIRNYLNEDLAREIVLNYYDQCIGSGNYYDLPSAIKIINLSHYNIAVKDALINTLRLIAQARSIYKAREQFINGVTIKNTNPRLIFRGTKSTFKKNLDRLRELNINPVLIPREWNIKFLPNPRNALTTRNSIFLKAS